MTFDKKALSNFLYKNKEEQENKSFKQDERIWSPVIPSKDDKNKYVYKIRILPIVKGDKFFPHEVEVMTHQYKSPVTGTWITEKCLRSIGEKCPVCEYSWALKSSGNPTDEAKSKTYYRKRYWYTNILVIKEPNEKRKDNEGKVFMWKYGIKIHEKLEAALFPADGGEQVLFLHPLEGFDFNLTVQMKEDFPNFDLSDFSRTATPIADNSEGVNEILGSVYDLSTEYLSRSTFKNYDTLKEILDISVVGKSSSKNVPVADLTLTRTPVSSQSEKVLSEVKKTVEDVPMFSSKEVTQVVDEKKSKPADENDFLAQLEAELGM